MGEIEVIFLLKRVIRKLVSNDKSYSPGVAVVVDDVYASDLSFLAAIVSETWRSKRLSGWDHTATVSLVGPLGLCSYFSNRGLAACHSNAKHTH